MSENIQTQAAADAEKALTAIARQQGIFCTANFSGKIFFAIKAATPPLFEKVRGLFPEAKYGDYLLLVPQSGDLRLVAQADFRDNFKTAKINF